MTILHAATGPDLLTRLQQMPGSAVRNDGQPLIICPAGFVDIWRQVNEQYGLGAEALSHGSRRRRTHPADWRLGRHCGCPCHPMRNPD